MQKLSLFHLFMHQIKSIRYSDGVLSQDWPHPFLTKPTQKKISLQLLICMNLNQHAKNQLTLSVHFWYTVNFKIQKSNLPHLFLQKQNQIFFECNWTRTQIHLVLKRTLNHLAKLAYSTIRPKWLIVRLKTKWF